MTTDSGGDPGARHAGDGILVAPAFLRMGNIQSLPSFEGMSRTQLHWILVRIVKGGSPRLWLAFGGVAGVALLVLTPN